MGIEEGDLVMPLMATDRNVVGYRVVSPASEDDLVVPLAATDEAVGLKVVSMTKEDQIGFGGMAADQEVVALTTISCEPEVLGSEITNNSNPEWDLTEFQGPGQAPPYSFWRIVETGSCLIYHRGCVDGRGELVNLPSVFRSHYYYNGYMELQIGCLTEDGYQIEFPGSCRTPESRSYYPSC